MPDTYTETTSRGFFSRLFGSFAGLLLGPVIILIAVGLLWWNEGRAVRAIIGLNAAASDTVEVPGGAPLPANEGKLVHIAGRVSATAPIADSDVATNFSGQAAVARTVEMYQWKEKSQSQTSNNVGGSQTTTTTYTYMPEWSEMPVDSAQFHHPEGHTNPAMTFRSQLTVASDAKLGGYTLDRDTLSNLKLDQSLSPASPAGWNASGGELYKGDAAAPKVGDLRVAYHGLPVGATVSVLAAQSSGGFAPFVTPNGYSVRLAAMGNQLAASMIATERGSESTLTWILRGVGTLAMIIGFAMLFGPLSTMASVIPLLGRIVGGAAVFAAAVVGIPLSLVVIALAWIGHRPVIGGGILLLALLLFYGLWRMHTARRPVAKAA